MHASSTAASAWVIALSRATAEQARSLLRAEGELVHEIGEIDITAPPASVRSEVLLALARSAAREHVALGGGRWARPYS